MRRLRAGTPAGRSHAGPSGRGRYSRALEDAQARGAITADDLRRLEELRADLGVEG